MAGAGDFIRIGLQVRALRRRRNLRQRDVALVARVAQSTVSLVERGHGDRVTTHHLEAIVATLDARLDHTLRWRAGDLDRLMDEEHAGIGGAVAALLRAVGWHVRAEVTHAVGREHGSIDLLAWHAPTRSLLVIEIKTEIVSGDRMLRTLDVKVRLAPGIARRLGWNPTTVSRLVVVAESSTNRRRVTVLRPLLGAGATTDARQLRRWVRTPTRRLDGIWQWTSDGRGRRDGPTGAHRVTARRSTRRTDSGAAA